MSTTSESLFEELCQRAGLRFERVPTADGQQSPDYVVWLGGQRVIAEIKQFDPNSKEEDDAEARARGEVFVQGPKLPGDRVRSAIRKAAPQLKALSCGREPTMVVVYNATDVSLHTMPEAVAMAMEGIEVVSVHVPHDPSVSPTLGESRSGPKRMMTPEHNTTVSAVGVLCWNWDRELQLAVYHNRYARHPIDPDAIQLPSVLHFRRPEGSKSSLDGWEEA